MPNDEGSPTGPPEPRSWSFWSSVAALLGLKKSCALMLPSPDTASRTTDSDSSPGGLEPGAGGGVTPLPVDTRIRPAPSETGAPPLIQIPALPSPEASSVAHSFIARVEVFTPTTKPTYGPWSQCEPNPR